jgi:hypothetical protein
VQEAKTAAIWMKLTLRQSMHVGSFHHREWHGLNGITQIFVGHFLAVTRCRTAACKWVTGTDKSLRSIVFTAHSCLFATMSAPVSEELPGQRAAAFLERAKDLSLAGGSTSIEQERILRDIYKAISFHPDQVPHYMFLGENI